MTASNRKATAAKPENGKLRPLNRRLEQLGAPEDHRPCHAVPLSHPEQRYCLLFQQSLAGIYTTTLEGEILDCNDAMVRMLRYPSRAEVMAMRASNLYFSEADRLAFVRELQRHGSLVNFELRLRRKDGTPVHVLENVCLIRDETDRRCIIHGNMVDITDRKRAEEALKHSEKSHRETAGELRRLADHQEAVREGERARIARELHDEFGQALTALNMDLHWLTGRLQEGDTDVATRINAMLRLVGNTAETLQRICADLRPTVLDDFGLIAAIEWGARQFQRRTGILCRVKLPRRTRCPLPKDQATAVFRIFQESLTNVGRHAQATEVHVALAIRSGRLTLTVADNGKGIAPEQIASGHSLGLIGIRERALAWRGQVDINGSTPGGTTVTVRMPVASNGSEMHP